MAVKKLSNLITWLVDIISFGQKSIYLSISKHFCTIVLFVLTFFVIRFISQLLAVWLNIGRLPPFSGPLAYGLSFYVLFSQGKILDERFMGWLTLFFGYALIIIMVYLNVKPIAKIIQEEYGNAV